MESDKDDLLKSMLTGMDGTPMETLEQFGVAGNEINLDEFNLELLSPISSSSDGSNTIFEAGENTQNTMLDPQDVLASNVDSTELDLIDYLSNGKFRSN